MKKKLYSLLAASALMLCGATLYSCGGTDDPIDEQGPGTDPVEDTLSAAPATLTFEYNDTETQLVEVEKTADTYNAECPEEWVVITKSTESFTVGVKEYLYADAEAAGFAPRTATITVSSGNAEEVTVSVSQNSPVEIVYEMTTDPKELVFEAGGSLDAIVEITTNVTSDIEVDASGFDWITDVSVTGNILSVTVSKYIGTTDRTGHITLSSEQLEEPCQLNITQKPIAPLSLEGTWSWTGRQFAAAKYTDASGTLTATYDETNGYYKFGVLTEYYAMGEGMSMGDGGFALRVDENNNVVFRQFDKLFMYTNDMAAMFGMSMSFHNLVRYTDMVTNSESSTPLVAYNTDIAIEVSADGNTITFPLTGIADDEEEYNYVFGFGGIGYDPATETEFDPQAEMQKSGIWGSFVLTRE